MHFIRLHIAADQLDEQTINKTLGIAPTLFYRKGEQRLHKGKMITYTESCWVLEQEVSDKEDFSVAVEQFLNRFAGKEEPVHRLLAGSDATLWLTLYVEAPQQNVHFSSQTLQRVSRMGIALDISMMSLAELYHA